jgi:hypothetical protein
VDGAVVAVDERGAQRVAAGLVQADRRGHRVGRAGSEDLAQRLGRLDLEAHEVIDHRIHVPVFEHFGSARLYQSDEVVGEPGR